MGVDSIVTPAAESEIQLTDTRVPACVVKVSPACQAWRLL